MLDAAVRTLARCEAGLDPATLDAISESLRTVVAFDRLTLHVEDEGRETFWVMWRASGDEKQRAAESLFPLGVHLPRDAFSLRRWQERAALGLEVEPFTAAELKTESSIDRALLDSGVRSYFLVPIVHRGVDLGCLSFLHEVPGAPSQRARPLLTRLASALAPALARALEIRRGRLFSSLVEASHDGMLALDRAGTIIEANRAALTLLGAERADVVRRGARLVLGDEVEEQLTSPWEEGRAKTLALTQEVRGEAVALDVLISRVEGTTDAAFQVHLRDARARRAAEEAAARRMAHFAFLRDLSESMAGDLRVQAALERAAAFCAARPDVGGVVMFRAEGVDALRMVASRGSISRRIRERLEHVQTKDLESMLGTYATDVKRVYGVVEAVGAAIDPEATGLVPRWKILVPIVHARRQLGAILVLGKHGVTLTDSERELWESAAGVVSAALHAAEDFEEVVALEAEKRQLVDNLPVIVARVDPKTSATLFVNGAVERILGYAKTDVLGTPGMDGLFADPIEWEASAVARDRAARGRDATWQDRRYRHRDGRVLTLRESVYPVRDATGEVRAIEVIAYDVTTEIESRKQLMQADRLASIGSLAGGIAHEINNPVAFIGLAASQLTRMLAPFARAGDIESVGRMRELVQEVGEASARIANIVGELKLFTRIPEGAHATPVDVNRVLQMAVTLTSAELRRRAHVEVNLGELPLVPGEFSILGQAFVNLLLNAAQAIDAKAPASGAANVVRISTFVDAGAIVVRVSDTGVGIEPRVLPRIFDPFFKTRAAGEGAGLGLAIAHNLAHRLGGDIRVTSELGEGSTFDVVLPLEPSVEIAPRLSPSGSMRTSSVVPLANGANDANGPNGARGHVLIVDDEQALAKALARQLSERWDVDTVSTARDALAELSVHRYDVVVCDLRMPDQSGPAILDATRARSPRQAARFIFTTGGSYGLDDDEIQHRAEASGRPILEKPFDGASFEALVEQVANQED